MFVRIAACCFGLTILRESWVWLLTVWVWLLTVFCFVFLQFFLTIFKVSVSVRRIINSISVHLCDVNGKYVRNRVMIMFVIIGRDFVLLQFFGHNIHRTMKSFLCCLSFFLITKSVFFDFVSFFDYMFYILCLVGLFVWNASFPVHSTGWNQREIVWSRSQKEMVIYGANETKNNKRNIKRIKHNSKNNQHASKKEEITGNIRKHAKNL